MAISTYGDLKTTVATWLNRTDLTSVIPDFITLAESDLRNDVRVQAMETLATGTLSGETLSHPSRLIEARRLVVEDSVRNYVVPDEYQQLKKAQSTMKVFTSIGQSFYILGGASGDDYTLTYTAMFAALSVDADTNWLLTNAPDVYLFAACKHGATYLASQTDEVRFTALYNAAVARINGQEKRAAFASPLRMQVS